MPTPLMLKQGEAKTLTLTVKEDGAPADLTGATLFLGVKKIKSDQEYTFSKDDEDFDKGQAAQGTVSIFLAAADTGQEPGPYVGELKVTFPGSPQVVEKSGDLALVVQEAVTV